MKNDLISAPILGMPDFLRPFEVIADTSMTALRVAVLQDHHPTAFDSKKFNPTELNYSTME